MLHARTGRWTAAGARRVRRRRRAEKLHDRRAGGCARSQSDGSAAGGSRLDRPRDAERGRGAAGRDEPGHRDPDPRRGRRDPGIRPARQRRWHPLHQRSRAGRAAHRHAHDPDHLRADRPDPDHRALQRHRGPRPVHRAVCGRRSHCQWRRRPVRRAAGGRGRPDRRAAGEDRRDPRPSEPRHFPSPGCRGAACRSALADRQADAPAGGRDRGSGHAARAREQAARKCAEPDPADGVFHRARRQRPAPPAAGRSRPISVRWRSTTRRSPATWSSCSTPRSA